MLKVIVTQRAKAEVEDIASSMHSLAAGLRFISEARATYERIAMMPTLGNVIEAFDGTIFEGRRHCTIKRFRNYVVIYSCQEDTVTIHRVFNGRRDYQGLFSEETSA